MRRFVLVVGLFVCTLFAFTMVAQDARETETQEVRETEITVTPMAQTPVYRVNVVSRSVQAVDYRHSKGWTKIDFRGTALMPDASGQAKVRQPAREAPESMQSSRMCAMPAITTDRNT